VIESTNLVKAHSVTYVKYAVETASLN